MRLTIYMKSGNRIRLTGVKSYTAKNMGNEIVSLRIAYHRWKISPRLLIQSIDLSQIEAMTCT